MDNGDGTFVIEDSGGGDGGGGGCGIGEHDSTTYAIRTAKVCVPDGPPPCVQSSTNYCYAPFTHNDSISTALMFSFIRNPNSIPEPAKTPCAAMINNLVGYVYGGLVFRGQYNTPPGDSSHKAQTWHHTIHVEPAVLDSAFTSDNGKRFLLSFLLHEVAHMWDFPHPGETSMPYNSLPFSYVNVTFTDPTNTCVN